MLVIKANKTYAKLFVSNKILAVKTNLKYLKKNVFPPPSFFQAKGETSLLFLTTSKRHCFNVLPEEILKGKCLLKPEKYTIIFIMSHFTSFFSW